MVNNGFVLFRVSRENMRKPETYLKLKEILENV